MKKKSVKKTSNVEEINTPHNSIIKNKNTQHYIATALDVLPRDRQLRGDGFGAIYKLKRVRCA